MASIPSPFTDAEVQERVQHLSARCFMFVTRFSAKHSVDLSFDPIVVINIAQSAMDDIWRYKVYHLRDPDKKSDAVKRAAYFTKWIVRFRPIHVIRPLKSSGFLASFKKDNKTLMLNEGFAISLFLHWQETQM